MRGSIQEGTHATNESLRRMLWMHNWSNRAPTTGEELKIFESAYIGVRDQSALMFWILRNYDHVHVFLWGFPLSPLSAGQCVTGVFVLWVRNYSYAHTLHICRRWCYCLLAQSSPSARPMTEWVSMYVCMGHYTYCWIRCTSTWCAYCGSRCWISEAFSSKFVIIVACLVTRPWLAVLITKTNMHVVCWTNNLETCFGFLFCLLLSSHRPHMVFSLEVQLQLLCVG